MTSERDSFNLEEEILKKKRNTSDKDKQILVVDPCSPFYISFLDNLRIPLVPVVFKGENYKWSP